jgi:hypothetical protein
MSRGCNGNGRKAVVPGRLYGEETVLIQPSVGLDAMIKKLHEKLDCPSMPKYTVHNGPRDWGQLLHVGRSTFGVDLSNFADQ